MNDFTVKKIKSNSINIGLYDLGKGLPIVFLHGFPEGKEIWKPQIKALNKNFRTIAPDLRGYGDSDKPEKDYRIGTFSSDILGLLKALKIKKAVILGHNWGGVIAWDFAHRFENYTAGLIIMNAPHPLGYLRGLTRIPLQILRSWYVMMFQIPVFPEFILTSFKGKLIRHLASIGTNKNNLTVQKGLEDMVNIAVQKGSVKYGIKYYREALPSILKSKQVYIKKISSPSLVLWGEKDIYLSRSLTENLRDYCENLTVKYFPDCSHWINLEAVEEINEEISKFMLERARF